MPGVKHEQQVQEKTQIYLVAKFLRIYIINYGDRYHASEPTFVEFSTDRHDANYGAKE
jgi:hypothetical protein